MLSSLSYSSSICSNPPKTTCLQTPTTALNKDLNRRLHQHNRRAAYEQSALNVPEHTPLALSHDLPTNVIPTSRMQQPPSGAFETFHATLPAWYIHDNYSQSFETFSSPESEDLALPVADTDSWTSMQSNRTSSSFSGFGGFGNLPLDGLKRQSSSHQRASSTSTIASNGPASPYSLPSANPHIANTDVPPFDHSVDFAKDVYPVQHTSTNPAFLSASYLPVQTLSKAATGHRFYDYANDFSFSAQHMSNLHQGEESAGNKRNRNRLGNGEGTSAGADDESLHQTDLENRALHQPQLQLSRTESAAYQDELFNPANFVSTPASAAKPARSQAAQPAQRTLVKQYLESANMARSVSPRSEVSRERSPFREGSELAPSEVWNSPHNPIQTAASQRQQMKLEREEAERAAHRPQLQREPTKTISPKDAMLDYNDPDQSPLIQDVVPAGYKQHFGGSEPYTDNIAVQQNSSFSLPASSQQNKNVAGFRAASGDTFTTPNFSFSPSTSQTSTTMQNPFQMGAYQHLGQLDPTYGMTSMADPAPQFPATLTSMESSISDQVLSSQDSANYNNIQRPADTRAHAGTYTCTVHGCASRFESASQLQKHKKEYHQSQHLHPQARSETLSVEASSDSPRSTESPGPVGSGLTSAQILARNSQAGPHKCTRTNPSTGKPCNTVFSRPYDLTRHEDTIHNGRKHKVRCQYCREEKTFSRNDALTRHMRVVHPDVDSYGKRGRRGD